MEEEFDEDGEHDDELFVGDKDFIIIIRDDGFIDFHFNEKNPASFLGLSLLNVVEDEELYKMVLRKFSEKVDLPPDEVLEETFAVKREWNKHDRN